MREIKSRGKRVDNGEWVYGSLLTDAWFKSDTKETIPYIFTRQACKGCSFDCDNNEDLFSCDNTVIEVIPETVGEYTGLQDKNGTVIYEGDILKDFICYIGYVIWNDKAACFSVIGCNDYGDFCDNLGGDKVPPKERFEVIGNIHDNPELLKESE